MTTTAVGFGNGLIGEREWALLNHLGDYGITGQAVTAAGGDRTVSVATGTLAIKGILAEVTAAQALQAGANGSAFTRVDSVIWRLDWGNNTGTLLIKAGTPGASPQPPVLTSSVGVGTVEFAIAHLTVAPGQGAFLSGNVVSALLLRYPVEHVQSIDAGPSAGTSYVFPGSPNSVAFVAPPSGMVTVNVFASMSNTVSGQATLIAFEIRQGLTESGAVFAAAADDNAIVLRQTVNEAVGSGPRLVTGLTPGTQYTAWTKVRVGGGTGTWYYRRILVDPVL